MNLRNRLSHGQLRYRNANYLNAVLTLFDTLKCLITLNSADYLNYFGIPQETLSPSTQYDQETDLSLFTDLNKQIIGYGTSTDGHTLVVIRENGHEDHTELFVDRGRVQFEDSQTVPGRMTTLYRFDSIHAAKTEPEMEPGIHKPLVLGVEGDGVGGQSFCDQVFAQSAVKRAIATDAMGL